MNRASDRLTSVVIAVLDADPALVNDDSSPHNLENWDSVAHLQLMAAVESEFSVSFTMDQIITFDSIGSIRQTLRQMGAEA